MQPVPFGLTGEHLKNDHQEQDGARARQPPRYAAQPPQDDRRRGLGERANLQRIRNTSVEGHGEPGARQQEPCGQCLESHKSQVYSN